MADGELWSEVGDSYDREAQRYFDHVRAEMDRRSVDRAGLRLFAELVGPNAETLDAGCGPGHIAAFLAARGLHVSGVDISLAMIELARASFPAIAFDHGRLTDLPRNASSVDAVVSRHSIIHARPEHLDEVLAEFARVLKHGGRLYLSFFATAAANEHGQPFDHAVCTAFTFDPMIISTMLADHGFEEEVRIVRQPLPDERPLPHATLFARWNEPVP